MRKVALLAAVALAATFSATTANAQKKPDPALAAQANTAKFMAAAMNPGAPAAKPAAPAKKKVAKKGGKKKKKKA